MTAPRGGYEAVVAALEAAGHQVRDGSTRCPAHDDRKPSLRVNPSSDGKALVLCQAGCATDEVLAVVGLSMRDLFVHPERRRGNAPVERYPYHDAEGRHLLDVLVSRQGREKSVWREPSGVSDVPLYRLPEVLAAVAAGQPVVVVEGEKCAEAVRAAGRVATTNAGGAGKWRAAHSRSLVGAPLVTVIADADRPGIAHALDVATSLRAAGVTAVRTALPKHRPDEVTGYDVADQLAAGHALDDLDELTEETAPRSTLTKIGEGAARGPETPWGKSSPSVTTSLRCRICFQIYTYLDEKQGTRSWAVRGVADLARDLALQQRTATKHLEEHLAAIGLISLDPPPNPSWGNTMIRVDHAPSRGRYVDDLRAIPEWSPDPPARWRKPSKTADEIERLRANGWRDALPVRRSEGSPPSGTREAGPPNGRRDALPVRENEDETGGGHADRMRDALPVRRSEAPSRDVAGGAARYRGRRGALPEEARRATRSDDPSRVLGLTRSLEQGSAIGRGEEGQQPEPEVSTSAPTRPETPTPAVVALFDEGRSLVGPCRDCGRPTGLGDDVDGRTCSRCRAGPPGPEPAPAVLPWAPALPPGLYDLPLDVVGSCRVCRTTTVTTDGGPGAICRRCHDPERRP